MIDDEKDPTHRFDNGEREPSDDLWNAHSDEVRFNLRAIVILLIVVCVLLLAICTRSLAATEFTFAPHSPAAFRATVRKVIASRPACEAWEETPIVPFWKPAPLTFQAVKVAFITPLPGPYASLPLTSGEIYRRGNIAAWVFRSGNRDFITVSTGIRTSKSDMVSDINAELDTWLKGR